MALTLEKTVMEERIRAAASWLCRSQAATGCGGSAAYYAPLWGWSAPYPETTGYIIPTMWKCADHLGEPAYHTAAMRMAEWLLTLQSPEGWFAGGLRNTAKKPQPSVFNSAQILFGLLEAAERTGDQVFEEAAARTVAWLIAQQDEDGRWRTGAYFRDYSPSYYAHVSWPLALYWKRRGGEEVRRCVLRSLDAILSDRSEVGTFRSWGFRPGRPAFTHTVGYTLQGLVESARLLDCWFPYGTAALETASVLLRQVELRKRLAGAYGPRWEPSAWFACLTGHCQIALTWLRLYEKTTDPRFLNGAVKALEEVSRRQRLTARRPNIRGAIAGSFPLYGPYMMLRYPNWAAKFFIDALFALLDIWEQMDSDIARGWEGD